MPQDNPFIFSAKNSFTAGELTPTMDGRSDLAVYQNGVRKLMNFFPLPSGGAVRRSGTEYIAVIDEEKEEKKILPKVMLPLVISRDITYLIIFEIDAENDKTKCSFLSRGQGEQIEFKTIDLHFKKGEFSYAIDNGFAYISFGIKNTAHKLYPNPEFTETHQNKTLEELNALPLEEKKKAIIIEEFAVTGKSYRNLEGGRSDLTFNEVMAYCQNDDMAQVRGHLDGYQREDHNINKLSCNSLVMFNRRLWCLGLGDNIHGILASYAGKTDDFDVAYLNLLEARNPLKAIYATFLSGSIDSIMWTITFAKELIIATTDGIYILTEGDRVKGEFIKVHKEMDVSISKIKPVMMGKTIFFVGGDKRKIYSFYYSKEKGGYQISAVNVYAEHLFNCGIATITSVESPFNMLITILKDGSFASFVYDQELKLMGWSQHFLGGDGHVLDATSMPNKYGEKIYFRVVRTITRGSETKIKKEFLESLDCKYLTAKYSNIPHEINYLDCYSNIYREDDIKIDKAFHRVFEEDNIDQLQAESEIVTEFSRESREFTDEEIESDFIVGNQFVRFIEEENRKETAKSFIRGYFGTYREKISSIIGLKYALAELATKFIGYEINYLTGDIEFKHKADDLFTELEEIRDRILQDSQEIIDWIDTYKLDEDKKWILEVNIKYKADDEEEDQRNINKNFDIENYFLDIFLVFLNTNRLGLAELFFSINIIRISSHRYILNPDSTLKRFNDDLGKALVGKLNKEFLLDKTRYRNIDLKEYADNEKEKSWLNDFVSKMHYLFLSHDMHSNQYMLHKDLVDRDIINNKFASKDAAKEWIASILPKICYGQMRKIIALAYNMHSIDQFTTKLMQAIFESNDITLNQDIKRELLQELPEFIEDWFTDNSGDLMSDIKTGLDNKLDELQGIEPVGLNALGLEESEEEEDDEEYEAEVEEDDEAEADYRFRDIVNSLFDQATPENEAETITNFRNRLNERMHQYSNIGLYETEQKMYFTLFYTLTDSLFDQIAIDKNNCNYTYSKLLSRNILQRLANKDKEVGLQDVSYMSLFHSREHFPIWKKLFPDINIATIKVFLKLALDAKNTIIDPKIIETYKDYSCTIVGDEEEQFTGNINDQVTYKTPSHFVTIGFNYISRLDSFPFIFPDDLEHIPKQEAMIGLKVYNSKGGHLRVFDNNGMVKKYEIKTPTYDIRSLDHYRTEKKHLIKETASSIETPFLTGWVDFPIYTKIDKDISFTFVIDQPYPITLLKSYVKAKILPHYVV